MSIAYVYPSRRKGFSGHPLETAYSVLHYMILQYTIYIYIYIYIWLYTYMHALILRISRSFPESLGCLLRPSCIPNIYIYIYIYIMCIHVYMYIYIYMYMCVYTYNTYSVLYAHMIHMVLFNVERRLRNILWRDKRPAIKGCV